MFDLGPAADRLAALVQGVGDDQLALPTPCPGYTLGDLLDHVGGLAVAFAEAARKERGRNAAPPPEGSATALPADWRTRIPADLSTLAGAWRTSGAWDGTTLIAGAEMPAEIVGRVAIEELVVHGWDLARASGQSFDADDASIDASLEFLGPLAQPEMADARAPAYGAVVEVAGDAPPLDRLLGLSGRDPSWSAT